MRKLFFCACLVCMLGVSQNVLCQSEVMPRFSKLKSLYSQFQIFRDNDLFRKYGFTANSPYAEWFQRVRALERDPVLAQAAKNLAGLAVSYRLRGADSDVYQKFLARYEALVLKRFAVVFTGDTRGVLFSQPAVPQPVGGLSRRLPALEQTRGTEPSPVVLDAGDTLANDSDDAAKINEVLVQSMNLMGYDGMGLGPNDVAVGEQALKHLAAAAQFPFVCTNLELPKGEPQWVKPYIILQRQDIRIAVLSFLPEDVTGLQDAHVISPLQAMQKYLPKMRAEADSVVVLSRMSSEAIRNLCDPHRDIDIVVGSAVSSDTGSLFYVEAPDAGRGFGVVRLERVDTGDFIPFEKDVKMLADQPADKRITQLLSVLYQ